MIQHVIELNNHATALMKQGLFRDAVTAVSTALRHHRELQLAKSSHDEEEVHATTTESDWIDKCMMCSDANESSVGSTEDFFYQRGIVIPNDVVDSTGIAPILIFNSALCYQLLARQQYHTSSPQRVLLKAKRLYELAHELEDTEDNVLFKFAVINNTALIHKALGNETMSRECFDFLMSLMMLFVDRGCSAHLHHVQGFFANVSSMARTAPAA